METILIVDDEPEVLAVACDMLQVNGYATLDARDPATALRIVETESRLIDLLLTDVVMPLMSGPQLAEKMRTIHPGIKVLYMSAFTTEAVQDYGVRMTAGEPFVVKPFTMETLTAKVRLVLDYRSPFTRPHAR